MKIVIPINRDKNAYEPDLVGRSSPFFREAWYDYLGMLSYIHPMIDDRIQGFRIVRKK